MKFKLPLNIPVKQLSGGQRQILSILAILQKPIKVLLLDEPTAALDDENKHIILNLLIKLAQDKDIIIISICHDNEIISKYKHSNIIKLLRENNLSLLVHDQPL